MGTQEGGDVKVLVFSDMEGASGIHTYEQVIKEFGEPFEQGRRLLMGDINAAIEGLSAAGATDFVVADSHRRGSPPNVIDDELPQNASVIRGDEISRFDYSDLAGQVLIGFHSRAGTENGFLSHTMSSLLGFAVRVNGRWVGEGELEIWKAGRFDVPTIMAAGDSALASEIKSFFSDIPTVTVKISRTRTEVRCLDPKETQDQIRKTSARALKNLSSFKVNTLKGPISLVIACKTEELTDWTAKMPRANRIHKRAISYEAENWEEARAAYHTAYHLAFRLVDPASARLADDERVKEMRRELVCKMIRERWAEPLQPLPDIP